MKYTFKIFIYFVLLVLVSSSYCFSQDTIFYKNASNIVVIVKEVSQTEVQYKKVEMPDGPMYIINKNDIEKIVYKNGYTDIIKAVAAEPASQSFTVTYDAPVSVGKQTIIYSDTKSRFSRLITLIDRHPDASIKPALMNYYRSMRHLKAGQDATRTVAIVFGALTIPASVFALLGNFVTQGSDYTIIPITTGAVALACTAAAVTFNINLKKKRHAFVNLYNQ